MDKKTTVHVAAEAAVFGALTLYLVNRIASLEQRVSDLEREVIIVAKKEAKVEASHSNALRSLLENGVKHNGATDTPSHVHNHPPHVHNHAPPSAPPHVHNHAPPTAARKVTFSDDQNDDDEEALLEREFGGDDATESESVESPPQARKKPSGKAKGRSRIKVVSAPPPRKGQKGKDMDDVKAQAEAMRRAAEGDD